MTSQVEIAAQIKGFEGSPDSFIADSIKSIAQSMVDVAANVQEGQNVLIWFDPPGTELARELWNRCLEKDTNVTFFRRSLGTDAVIISELPEEEIPDLFEEEVALINAADVILIVRGPNNPEVMSTVPPEKTKAYFEAYSQTHQPRIDMSVDWTLFLYPTRYEATKEGFTTDESYVEYFKMVMEACNQPWEEIKATQTKLVDMLDQGEILQFIANENDPDPKKRTNVTMSIKDMTFCNSTIDVNYPGSEVFSAPVIDSVNGQIFAPGQYLEGGHLMEDIYLTIENGKIIEAYAEKGNEGLQKILSQGEGARFFGEVAFGTNPGLTRRFFNPLLNEKVGGSFHMAIGHCYTFTEYDGMPVNVNNGNTQNKTPIHWDMTILMHPDHGGGRVLLDGEVIQENGKFVDPELALLNPAI